MVEGAGWPPIRGEIGGSCTTHLKATANHVDSRCVLVSVHDGITHWTVQYFGRLPLAYEVGPYDDEVWLQQCRVLEDLLRGRTTRILLVAVVAVVAVVVVVVVVHVRTGAIRETQGENARTLSTCCTVTPYSTL